MGYDLHITRADDWMRSPTRPIEPSEWLAVVEADPELWRDLSHGPCFVWWRRGGEDTNEWLDWDDGRVFGSQPSPALAQKMVGIAAELGATIQGDGGEPLGLDGEADDGSARPPGRMRSWFRELVRTKTAAGGRSTTPGSRRPGR
jgi:hypothetical protein